MTVLAAFPFIEVRIDTSGLTPVAQRSPGVIAIVGKTPAGPSGGTAAPNTPLVVSTADDAVNLFAEKVGTTVNDTQLSRSLKLALLQDPAPSKIYGVRVDPDYAAALAALEGVDDVTFVALAEEYDVGTAGPPATNLQALKAHVEGMSAQGLKRIGVAAVDPGRAKSPTYPADVDATMTPLRSTVSRMILVAARGASATTDVASAAMAAIAGFEPQVSMVLKKVRGIAMPLASQYSPSEIKQLAAFPGLELRLDPHRAAAYLDNGDDDKALALFKELAKANPSLVADHVNLGIALFKDYVVPFEISSVLFLSAMVGTVVIGKKE